MSTKQRPKLFAQRGARVVTAPAPLLRGAALPPNRVTSVALNPGEEVRWTWTHSLGGSYVSGYAIAAARRPKQLKKSKRRSRAKRQLASRRGLSAGRV